MKNDKVKDLTCSDNMRKSYKTPLTIVIDFHGEILQYQGSTSNGENGGELSSRERMYMEEKIVEQEHKHNSLW